MENNLEDKFNKEGENIGLEIKKETISSPMGEIETIEIIPEKEKDSVPVLFAPGWSVTVESSEDSLVELAKKGRRVISLSHPRVGGDKEAQKDISSEEMRKAISILTVINEKGLDKVDIFGYSEGAINSSILASSLAPKKVGNMVLHNPAGMIGKDSPIKISGRFLNNMTEVIKDELKHGRDIKDKVIIESFKYIVKNPLRSIKEINEISKSDIKGNFKSLNEKGINIAIVHNVDDIVFDKTVQEGLTSSDSSDGYPVQGYYTISSDSKSGHFDFLKDPEKIATVVDHALGGLRNLEEMDKEKEEK
jgi:hypothetical protein